MVSPDLRCFSLHRTDLAVAAATLGSTVVQGYKSWVVSETETIRGTGRPAVPSRMPSMPYAMLAVLYASCCTRYPSANLYKSCMRAKSIEEPLKRPKIIWFIMLNRQLQAWSPHHKRSCVICTTILAQYIRLFKHIPKFMVKLCFFTEVTLVILSECQVTPVCMAIPT